jgi:hypothetical protein
MVSRAGSCRHTLAQRHEVDLPAFQSQASWCGVLIVQQVRVTDDARGVSDELSHLWAPLIPSRYESRSSFL